MTIRMIYRFILAVSIFVLTGISAFSMNDLWLGYRYSVGVGFNSGHFTGTLPRLKALRMPDYPIDFVQAAVQGQTTIQFLVQNDGSVVDVKVITADFEEFGASAKRTVEKWIFHPGKAVDDQEPIAVKMECRFDFKIDDK